MEIRLILHNIRSLFNVGSLFRTADGAGVSALYLTGYTGYPPRKEIRKTALGADETIHWEHHWDIEPLLLSLQAEGFQIIGAECTPQSKHYLKAPLQDKVALILGNEVEGILPPLQAFCDEMIEVPMYGQKVSLNVAVCGGILLYGLREQGFRLT